MSAFGVGGTNAHVVLEEAPLAPPSTGARGAQLFVLSAKTPEALSAATAGLAAHLESHPGLELGDVARTLQAGRSGFDRRGFAVVRDAASARERLVAGEARPKASGAAPRLAFLFPGQGSQSPGMGAALYEREPVFRAAFDRCASVLEPLLGFDLRASVFGRGAGAAEALKRTGLTQPAIFSVSWSLAELWEAWGVRPVVLAGHSVGEFVAACRAGVFPLEDALRLVAARGRLMQDRPAGAMLAVRLSEADVAPYLEGRLDVAAVNAPSLVVVSGGPAEIEALERRLTGDAVAHRRLVTSHAFHSRMLDPILEPFAAEVARVRLSPPAVPIVSTVTGRLLSPAEATSPDYWTRHFRVPVRFSDALATLLEEPARVLLEVGPGQTLATLAKAHPSRAGQGVFSSLPRPEDESSESEHLLESLGRLWVAGVDVDWAAHQATERRSLVPLPSYPFERKRYWLDAGAGSVAAPAIPIPASGERDAHPAAVAQAPPPAAPEPADRRARVAARVLKTLEDQSGIAAADLSASSSFLELGFDSLILTQVSQDLQKEFGVRISFRQLLDESATPDLARRVDRRPACAREPSLRAGGGRRGDPCGSRSSRLFRGAVRPGARRGAEEKGIRGVRPLQADRRRCEERPHGPPAPRSRRLHAAVPRETPGSKRLTDATRAAFADPRVVAGFKLLWKEIVYPIVAVAILGLAVFDVDGNEYVDMLMGFGLNLFGHSPSFVTEAVAEQLRKGVEIGPQSPDAGRGRPPHQRVHGHGARDLLQHRLRGRHGRDAPRPHRHGRETRSRSSPAPTTARSTRCS